MVNEDPLTLSPLKRIGLKVRQKDGSREAKLTVLFALAHLPLGVILYNAGLAAFLHPAAVFGLGCYWAVRRQFTLDRVALAAGYLIGAEVLWRMAKIPVYWEFGKYGSAFIMVLALVVRRKFEAPKLAYVYFLALLPACFLTLENLSWKDAQPLLSFNMSGPLCLFVSCWFFSNVKVSEEQLRRVLYAIFIPLLSVAAVASFYTITAENIQFSSESNFETSGGFGPNQVSAMLGLGVLLVGSCFLLFRNSTKGKALLGIAIVLLAGQSVLTFSRGGMYSAVGALMVVMFFQFDSFLEGIKRILPMLLIGVLFVWVVFPLLNNFTGGKLLERFEETSTTNRLDIIGSDLDIFEEYPIFGVGVGISDSYRARFLDYKSASHTEFSRMISEHGGIGIIALLSLFLMPLYNLKRQKLALGRALASGVSAWSILFMANAGMRLAAPAFMLALAFLTITPTKTARRILRRPRPNSRVLLPRIGHEQDEDQPVRSDH
jgi:hypothetical protein